MRGIQQKKSIKLLVVMMLVTALLAACGGNNNKSSNSGSSNKNEGSASNSSTQTTPANKEREKVSVWYLWGGAEGDALEAVIKDFNESQDKYLVEGLSVPDEQKIKVAIAGGNGPDITDSFDWVVPGYAKQGIALPLDDLIARDNYDLSDFIPAALETGRYEGKLYSLPLNVSFAVMYYNKALLAEAGYTEPPKTSAELFEMAVKTTKVNSSGEIDTLGFPAYPSEPFNALAYAFGSKYVNDDASQLTINNEATREAMKMVYDYNTQFGVENVRQIQASGKWLDPTDPFLNGKQAIRFDGPWVSAHIKNKNIDLDYGIAPLPYLEGKPETAGSGLNSSSIFYIAKTAKNVDGAWEFMKYLYSPEPLAKFLAVMGNVPATKGAINSEHMNNFPDWDQIKPLLDSPNLTTIPHFENRGEFDKTLGETLELMFNLKKTPEETMSQLESELPGLLK